MTPQLVIVAAVAHNGVIGGNNRLLWRLPGDLKHFKALTLGKPMLMGRATFESIGKPLPGRESIVLTRGDWRASGVHVAHDLQGALALSVERAHAMGANEIIIAGGADVYAQTIGMANRMHITEVDMAPKGDAVFPTIDRDRWRQVARRPQPRGAEDECAFAFVEYESR
jgi:dihydrofolate reductase